MNHTNAWRSVQWESRGEIMKTDIYCEILCAAEDEPLARIYLEQASELFRDFEKCYSRFLVGNELWELNTSADSAVVSPELFSLLEQSLYWHKKTKGIFDPSILPYLESEGYGGAYGVVSEAAGKAVFGQLLLNKMTKAVSKPNGLKIDLGGIGKSFVIDKVADFFHEQFSHFLIDAGGDIMAAGENKALEYPYWAIGIEDPAERERSVATLILKNMAAATSGINRRTWLKGDIRKHHLIDPAKGESAEADFQSVTVLMPTTVEADIWAKTLLLSGKEKGQRLADEENIPAIFIFKDGSVSINNACKPYVWKSP